MRPIIGINCDFREEKAKTFAKLLANYFDSVLAAGGAPLLVPPITHPDALRRILSSVDGFILSGGGDYAPRVFGERQRYAYPLTHRRRQDADLAIAREVDRKKIPALGICLGTQLMNIVRGGTLIQHIPKQIEKPLNHRRKNTYDVKHAVRIAKGSRLYRIVKTERLRTNSSHHQSVNKPGKCLKIVARSSDGVVEAIEDTRPDRFFLGVQWHPEAMPGSARQRNFFKALITAAR